MTTVFLAAGHGGNDPGAVWKDLYEKDIVLDQLLACKAELERCGVRVITNRTTDVEVSLSTKCVKANQSGASIAVSFHANAGGGNGFEAYYYSGSKEGYKLARMIEANIKNIGQNSRGLKDGRWLSFVKNTTMPAVLCECGFVDNVADRVQIESKEARDKFGLAYADAILEYLGIKKPDKKEDKPVAKIKDKKEAGTRDLQTWLNDVMHASLQVDGIFGIKSAEWSVRALQRASGVTVDGIIGSDTRAACPELGVGDEGMAVRLLQHLLNALIGAGMTVDGVFGGKTKKWTQEVQKKLGITADGIAGRNTFVGLLTRYTDL